MIASTDFLATLAWSLLHFVWQGAAIAALAAALLFVFRRPDARYLIGIGALALMFASFAVTFALVGGAADADPTTSAARAPAAALASPHPDAIASPARMLGDSQAAMNSDGFLWVARLWLIGVCMLALRIAFGLFVIEQVRRRNLVELPPELVARFRALQARLGIHRVVRYCECPRIGVPAVIGFFRPIVLLPMRALTGLAPEQLEAVIAHELGHIKRFDVAVNFLQVIAETLFFFHPAVWWLNRRIRADREDCCDDVAVRACGESVGYARALASMATWRDVPALAMASTGGPVAARVARLLGLKNQAGETRTVSVFTATLVLATALIAGAVSIGVVRPAFAQNSETTRMAEEAAEAVDAARREELEESVEAREAIERAEFEESVETAEAGEAAEAVEATEAQEAIDPALEFELAEAAAIAEAAVEAAHSQMRVHFVAPVAPLAPLASSVSLEPIAPLAPLDPTPAAPATAPVPTRSPAAVPVEAPAAAPAPAPTPTPFADPVPAPTPSAPVAPPAPKPVKSYIDEMKLSGLEDLDADMLVAFKNQNIGVDFVNEMRQVDLNVDANVVLAMKVHGITTDYVRDIRKLGFEPDAQEIVAMKVHGIGTDYVNDLRKLGFEPEAQELIAMKVHGVNPAYVKEMRAAGFEPTAQELIQMKVHGVTPELQKTFERSGYKLGVAQLVEAQVMGITPEYIEKVRAHGFKDLSIRQLIQLKNANVL
jgi:beta-lactamase regulating signal transducer with metallopeptidase domain